MKLFSFGLNRVLNYRSYLEKKAQMDLANARTECMRREQTINELARKKMETARKCSVERYKGIDIPRYQLYISFLEKLNLDIECAYRSLEEGAEKVEVREDTLRKASIKRKTLEAMKELQQKRYIETASREEQKVLDELAIIRRWRTQ